jgi:hypothetical protein
MVGEVGQGKRLCVALAALAALVACRVEAAPPWCGSTIVGTGSFGVGRPEYSDSTVCDLELRASQADQVGFCVPRNFLHSTHP